MVRVAGDRSLPNSDVVKSSGAVSPAARAIASVVPVRIPLKVVGMITPTIVRHLLTPSARLPSRRWSRHEREHLLGRSAR